MDQYEGNAVMLNSLGHIDVIALDAAVAGGLPGERALRLLKNRSHIAPDRLPWVLLMTHSAGQQDC